MTCRKFSGVRVFQLANQLNFEKLFAAWRIPECAHTDESKRTNEWHRCTVTACPGSYLLLFAAVTTLYSVVGTADVGGVKSHAAA